MKIPIAPVTSRRRTLALTCGEGSTVLMPDLRPQVRGKEKRDPADWTDWVI